VNLQDRLATRRSRIEAALTAALPRAEGPARTVAEAMRHAVLAGGKRLRPALVLEVAEAWGGREAPCMPAAVAVELVHTYSLVHDDLPAMDDDDLRRGRPTVHKVFGEAIAILAGDALHTLAFELVATAPGLDAGVRAEAAAVLARAAGHAGMVGGQVADLEAERADAVDVERVRWIHRHKTGALLAASVEIGAVVAAASPAERVVLRRYGEALGLAFQIADDLLDRTATAEAIGKTPGKDERAGKATFPGVLGFPGARGAAEAAVSDALAALAELPRPTPVLAELARFALARAS